MKHILLLCASILFYSLANAMIPSSAVLEAFNKGISQSAKEEKLEALIKNNAAPKSARDDAAKRLAAEIFEDKIFVSESNRKSFMDPKLGLRVSDLNPILSPEHALALNDAHGLVAYDTQSDSIEILNLIKKFKAYSVGPSKDTLHKPTHIYGLAFSNDGSLLASVNRLGHVSIWKVPSDDYLEAFDTKRFTDLAGIRALAFAPKGDQIAAGDEHNGKIYLLKLDANKRLIQDPQLLVDTGTPIINLGFSRNGLWLAVRFENNKENLVNMQTAKLVLPKIVMQPAQDEPTRPTKWTSDIKEKQAFKEQIKLFEQVIEKSRNDSKP